MVLEFFLEKPKKGRNLKNIKNQYEIKKNKIFTGLKYFIKMN